MDWKLLDTQLITLSPSEQESVGWKLLDTQLVTLAPSSPPQVFTCPYCGRELATQAALNQHLQDAHGEAPPDWETWLEKYGLYLAIGVIALILLTEKGE